MSAFTDPDGYRRGFNGDTRGGTSSIGYRNGALAKDGLDRAFGQGPYAPSSAPTTTPFAGSGGVTPRSGSGGYYAASRSFFSFLGKIIGIIGFGFLVLIVVWIFASSNKTTTNGQKWPDGKLLSYPNTWVRAHPVKLSPADPSLKLRAGPSMDSDVLAKIPADANDIVL